MHSDLRSRKSGPAQHRLHLFQYDHHLRGDVRTCDEPVQVQSACKVTRIHCRGLPSGHDYTAHALVGLGTLLVEAGEPREAEMLLREAYAVRIKALPRRSLAYRRDRECAGSSPYGTRAFRRSRAPPAHGLRRIARLARPGSSPHATCCRVPRFAFKALGPRTSRGGATIAAVLPVD